MDKYIWKDSKYKLFKGQWGIAIWLEAGYQQVSYIDDTSKYIKLADSIYFHSMLSYSNNPRLTDEELLYFYNGIKMISKYLYPLIQDKSYLIIALKSILFSDCDIQIEGFTACAIQWASEIFGFPMPAIGVYFDKLKSQYGRYVFDFSSI